ncbi:hypothetical protein [Halocatena salina]|uniref:Uncharacterized protein n=1 Tax=Halocatena salina TaxID=2934340 RepID=A0A8U0A3Z0_9EURY|nr:hypothetical protein [Halocatena salina]UPM43168.1 hypothetical protein MW046_01665 [Halocatena salina]
MDRYDYDRLRARTLQAAAGNLKGLYLTMAFDELRRRDVIQLVDYATFHSPVTQERSLQRTQALLRNTPEDVHHRLAVDALDEWIDYGRGAYQKPFREAIGEETSSFVDLRSDEEHQQRKLKRGTSNPVRRNEKTLNKGMAALAIRQQTQQQLNLDVRGVICSSQYEIIDDFLSSATQSSGPGTDRCRPSIDTDEIAALEPVRRTVGINTSMISQTQDLLSVTSRVTTEIAGVQHNDWFMLSPSFAIPNYQDIFDFDMIHRQARTYDIERLVAEIESVINTLDASRADETSPNELQYDAGWVAEQFGLSSPTNTDQPAGLTDMVEYLFTLSNYARELRTLTERETVSEAAALIGVSIVESGRYHEDEAVYQRCMEMLHRLAPESFDDMKPAQFRKERQSITWRDSVDWFEAVDRWR